MKSIKVLGLTAVAVVSMMFFFGCAGSNSLKKDYGDNAKDPIPAKMRALMDGKYAQSIQAVGIATHSDETVALEKAGLDADQKIAKKFEQEISSLQKKFLEATNDAKLEEYRNTVESFTNIKIQGVSEVYQMTAEGKDGYKAYVLKVVSPEVLKNLIDQRTNALTNFKAVKAYQELEERVEKDNEAKAAQ